MTLKHPHAVSGRGIVDGQSGPGELGVGSQSRPATRDSGRISGGTRVFGRWTFLGSGNGRPDFCFGVIFINRDGLRIGVRVGGVSKLRVAGTVRFGPALVVVEGLAISDVKQQRGTGIARRFQTQTQGGFFIGFVVGFGFGGLFPVELTSSTSWPWLVSERSC